MFELNEETITELLDEFHDLYEQVENDLNNLANDPTKDRLASMFRGIHTIKGHAAIMQLGALVEFSHVMEEVAHALRSNKLTASPSICELLQLCMDRLRDMHYRDLRGHGCPNIDEAAIKSGLQDLAQSNDDESDLKVRALIRLMSGDISGAELPQATDQDFNQDDDIINVSSLSLNGSDRQLLDLAFFQELAFQCDRKNPYWLDRSIQLYDWSQKLNRLGGDKVDYKQLAAATYMHDVGMSFIPNDIIEKKDKLSELEIQEIRRHVSWGYDILIRMPRWEEAALIVLNHHEREDGKGYPNGLVGRLIHPGAKILAILDAFFSMIHGRADRNQRRSVIRAMSEINALSGSQFDPYYVDSFNQLIKTEAKRGAL